MARRASHLVVLAATTAALGMAACKTQQAPAPATVSGTPATTPSGTGGGSAGGGTSIPTLVNVNLQNVLNDLSVQLKVNRNNIPVNAQVPINVAANVCGVSVDALAAAIANGHGGCTATTTTPQLTQAIQQQMATGGSVTGGDQTMGTTTNNMM